MSGTLETSVHAGITVPVAADEAFALFTAGIDAWWPREGYVIGPVPLHQAVLETHDGGRWIERNADGSEHVRGRVLQWQPPRRVVLTWQISAEQSSDPALAPEVDVRFTDLGDGRTRIHLEHRHLDRYGERHGDLLAAYSSPEGWQGLLGAYAAAAAPMRFERHTLLMLVLRPDAPPLPEAEAAALQDAHLAYTADLVAGGHILAAGPPVASDDERIRGVSVWADDPDTVRRLCEADPAVRAGRLSVRIATWMTPAGQLTFERVRVPRSMAEAAEGSPTRS